MIPCRNRLMLLVDWVLFLVNWKCGLIANALAETKYCWWKWFIYSLISTTLKFLVIIDISPCKCGTSRSSPLQSQTGSIVECSGSETQTLPGNFSVLMIMITNTLRMEVLIIDIQKSCNLNEFDQNTNLIAVSFLWIFLVYFCPYIISRVKVSPLCQW